MNCNFSGKSGAPRHVGLTDQDGSDPRFGKLPVESDSSEPGATMAEQPLLMGQNCIVSSMANRPAGWIRGLIIINAFVAKPLFILEILPQFFLYNAIFSKFKNCVRQSAARVRNFFIGRNN
jgi:hypothetical protein